MARLTDEQLAEIADPQRRHWQADIARELIAARKVVEAVMVYMDADPMVRGEAYRDMAKALTAYNEAVKATPIPPAGSHATEFESD